MSRLYLELGPCPCNEEAAQTTDPMFREKNLRECQLFIQAIRNTIGQEPLGAQLKIGLNDWDGRLTYREVRVYYDEAYPEAEKYAHRVEAEAPTTWAEGKVVAPVRQR